MFAAEADAELDRCVGPLVVIGRANSDRSRGVDSFQLPPERRNYLRIEHADVDHNPLGTELEGPLQQSGHRAVGTGLQEVPLGDYDGDCLRESSVREPNAGSEVAVVQAHDPQFQAVIQNDTGCRRYRVERRWLYKRQTDGSESVSSGGKIPPIVTTAVRRAGAFAVVGTLALVAPLVVKIREPAIATVAAIAPFLLVAVFALTVHRDHVLFELFARPGDRRDGKLYGLAGFSLAAAGVAILSVGFGMPAYVYVGTVVLLAVGNLAGQVVRLVTEEAVVVTAGFVGGGVLASYGAQVFTIRLSDVTVAWPEVAFIAASGGLLAALLREMLFKRDDALVMVSVGLLLWLFARIPVEIRGQRIAVALALTVALGYASFALDTASIAGMLTGVLLSLLTIVLGDYGWFLMLVAFFGIGGLASKFRYEKKKQRGIAEDNDGARGTGNVLANSLVALVAVLLGAASSHSLFADIAVSEAMFFYAFAGAVGTALADTLSSEIGGLFDNPRLITTLEVVNPGTDGAVTWQGELAGLAGALTVAGIALAAFDSVAAIGAGCIVLASLVGMTVDSLLGSTIEGRLVGNQGVNFLATLAAAVMGAILVVGVDLSM